MILDDEALVERVARAISIAENCPEDWWRQFIVHATAAIEAVRVHMWDDGK